MWDLMDSGGYDSTPYTTVDDPPPPLEAEEIQVSQGRFGSAGVLGNVDSNNVQSALEKLDSALVTDHGALGGLSDDDHTQYIKHALATAVSDFLVASGAGAYIKKTLAEVKTILGLPEDHGALGGLSDDDHTQYIKHALSTAASDFLIGSGSNTFIKKTLAEVQALIGAGGLDSGTSFPASPSAGDTYFRSDLGFLFYYSGSEWRSSIQSVSFHNDVGAGDGGHYYNTPMRQDMTYAVSRITARTFPEGTNDNTHHWHLTVTSYNLAGSSPTVHYTFSTQSDTDGAWTGRDTAPTTASPGSNDYWLDLYLDDDGTPGDLTWAITIYYYWIAT
jgi:hypothetical protein